MCLLQIASKKNDEETVIGLIDLLFFNHQYPLVMSMNTPLVVPYLTKLAAVNGTYDLSLEQCDYGVLLAEVLEARGCSIEATAVYRALAHRAVGLSLSWRVHYLQQAYTQVSLPYSTAGGEFHCAS